MGGIVVAVTWVSLVLAAYFLGYYHGSSEPYDVWREDWGDDG